MLKNMALSGIKVVEMSGLAPAPFCGMILSDFGARVIRIDKANASIAPDSLCRGKQSIAVNLKHSDGVKVVRKLCQSADVIIDPYRPDGVKVVRKLCQSADVLIDPYRPGVMEKLGLGPEQILGENPRVVYARLTGFGQDGYYADRAGHDINYLAVSGVLSRLGRKEDKPFAPINLLADFAGGGLMCAFGITMALLERQTSGRGQVIDANMVEGAAYVSSFLWKSADLPIWGAERGTGWLDGGAHFYDTYRTSDGKYMSVGALEPQFYNNLLKGLDLSHTEAPQFGGEYGAMCRVLQGRFATKTQQEWCRVFDHLDACVAPVLERNEAHEHPHNKDKQSFLKHPETGESEPKPAPSLGRTPGVTKSLHHPASGENSREILQELGYSAGEIEELIKQEVVIQNSAQAKL